LDTHEQDQNITELVFCRDNVDPDFITQCLGLSPSTSTKVGELILIGDDFERASNVGVWKLALPQNLAEGTVEEQLAHWVKLLEPKAAALSSLRTRGHQPYIDCRAESRSLSLCIEPDTLAALGRLGVSLSVWLYESPVQHKRAD
jgi:hypothetical protein